jgi:hypothetical protein
MIKSISSIGRYLHVSGGTGGNNYINNFSGAQGVGNMRFNTVNQYIEIYDGNSWVELANSYATMGLDQEAIDILDWARDKQHEERKIKELIKTNPAVKIAYDAVVRAEEQLKITKILSTDETTTS